MSNIRRKSVGNDPLLRGKNEARTIDPRKLTPTGTYTPLQGPPPPSQQQQQASMPAWITFLSPVDISWIYAEPLETLLNGAGQTTQLIWQRVLTRGECMVVLEWTPVLLQKGTDQSDDLFTEMPAVMYCDLVYAGLHVDGRSRIGSEIIPTTGAGQSLAVGTRYMNRRAFVTDPNFPVCIYAEAQSTVSISFTYLSAQNVNLENRDLYVGSRLLGFIIPEMKMNEIKDYLK